ARAPPAAPAPLYCGLDGGFTARARATNFGSAELAETVAWIHRAGVRAYVTLNTLVFETELAVVEQLIRRVAAAGSDAVIPQDPCGSAVRRAHRCDHRAGPGGGAARTRDLPRARGPCLDADDRVESARGGAPARARHRPHRRAARAVGRRDPAVCGRHVAAARGVHPRRAVR